MKTIQVTIEVEVPENVESLDLASWINCHMDNILYEELVNFGTIDPDDLEDVNIVAVY